MWPKTSSGATISDIQCEDGHELDQELTRQWYSSDCSEPCSRPRQGEGFGTGEAGVVGGSLGTFAEELGVRGVTRGYFTLPTDCAGLS